MVIVGPREVVSEQDRNQRHRDHDDRDDVRDRTVARPEQLIEEPDRECALFAGGEYGDDDFVEGQRERQHATGEKSCRHLRQQYIPQRLQAVRAQVHGSVHPVRRQAAQPGDDIVVDDDRAERGMTGHDGEERRFDAPGFHGG